MPYAIAVCIALTIIALGAVVFQLLTRKEAPDAVVMGQQLMALKLGVTDLSERLDALYRKDRTAAARVAKEAPPVVVATQQPLELNSRRSKAELRAIIQRQRNQT